MILLDLIESAVGDEHFENNEYLDNKEIEQFIKYSISNRQQPSSNKIVNIFLSNA